MKISASESYSQHEMTHPVFPVANVHQVQSVTTGISLSRKENGTVCLYFNLRGVVHKELGAESETTVSLLNTSQNVAIPISPNRDQFVDLDPKSSYELTVTWEFSSTSVSGQRTIKYYFRPE